MLDEKDPQIDRRIAQRVITNHRFQGSASVNHLFNSDNVIEASLDQHQNKQDGKGTTIFDKDLSHGG
jgi:hypothetical protein